MGEKGVEMARLAAMAALVLLLAVGATATLPLTLDNDQLVHGNPLDLGDGAVTAGRRGGACTAYHTAFAAASSNRAGNDEEDEDDEYSALGEAASVRKRGKEGSAKNQAKNRKRIIGGKRKHANKRLCDIATDCYKHACQGKCKSFEGSTQCDKQCTIHSGNAHRRRRLALRRSELGEGNSALRGHARAARRYARAKKNSSACKC